jgi:Glycosyltransferases involved in cell wall biogenesis
MEYKKISVLIVTYKQADVIGRNIESILQQKEYGLHEIVICDDCSPDNNWEVIQGYAEKYPQIIRAYRNEQNLGIYGNSMKAASLHGDADLFCWLEGDDALCDGFFREAQSFIKQNAIDLNKSVGIFSDYYAISTTGNKVLRKNDFVLRNENPLGSFFRNLATWRASLFSKRVLDNFKPIELEKGLILAETLFDSQFFYIDEAYYNPIVGSEYYTGIGVSAQWGLCESTSSYKIEDNIMRWRYMMDNNIIYKKEDIDWAYCNIAYSSCLKKFSLVSLFKYVKNYITGLRGYQRSYRRLLNDIIYLARSKK